MLHLLLYQENWGDTTVRVSKLRLNKDDIKLYLIFNWEMQHLSNIMGPFIYLISPLLILDPQNAK